MVVAVFEIDDVLVADEQVARKIGRMLADSAKRLPEKSGRRHLRLPEASVRRALEPFGASLPREHGVHRVAMVEYPPVAVQEGHSAVVVVAVPDGSFRAFAARTDDAYVGVAYENASVDVWAERTVRRRIAQLVLRFGGIHEHVASVDLAYRRPLEEGVSVERRSLRIHVPRNEIRRRVVTKRDHVGTHSEAHRTVSLGVVQSASAGVEVDFIAVYENGWVELPVERLAISEEPSVCVANIREKLELSSRRRRDRDTDMARAVGDIVEIVASVDALHAVRRVERHASICVLGVVRAPVYDAFPAPCGEVVRRCGPRNVVVEAEVPSARNVVRPVDVHPVAEHARLAVGHALPARKVRIVGEHPGRDRRHGKKGWQILHCSPCLITAL